MEFSTPDLAVIEQLLTNIFTKSNCTCHFLDPRQTKIILWLEKKANQIIYHLRIGLQRFKSYPLTDKNNEPYWRFWYYPSKKESEKLTKNYDHNTQQFSERSSAVKQ